ncbi:MAG TPA: DUF4012 domain-containing protein [Patescibacteria group bacterium]
MPMKSQKVLLAILVGSGLLLLFSATLAGIWTHQSLNQAKSFQLAEASDKADQALMVVRPLSLMTLRLLPDIEIWRQALTLISESEQIVTTLDSFSAENVDPLTTLPLKPLVTQLTQVSDRLTQMETDCQRSLIAKVIIECHQLTAADQFVDDWLVVGNWLTEEDPTVIVLFQNTEELRATGGFMGSYAKVQFANGNISHLLIEDIYEPDGQFTGYVEPPAGVREYLSSGKGMRLPDANWQVDFPSAAQTILNYFALGNEQSIDGVIAINSDLVEKLLTVTGDIYLPDYGMTVTSANFTALARADRDQFFPGSQQKTNFLEHFFNVLKFKLTQLNQEQQLQLAMILRDSFIDKTIQLYSTQTDVQQIYEKYAVAGSLTSSPGMMYLVESNVGINKANKDIQRSVELNIAPFKVDMHVKINATDLPYINYQRLIINPLWSIESIEVNGQRLETWDEEVITNSHGHEFRQIGFLVTVPTNSSTGITIVIDTTNQPATDFPLQILKQPGLPPTPYTIITEEGTESFILEKDI